MITKANLHTHCCWCDGQDTPDQMAEAALKLGFTGLGFSSHSPAPFDPSCPGISDEQGYRSDIQRLKQKYQGQLDILCGVEQEYYAPVERRHYDYIIGSCHYFELPKGIDRPTQENCICADSSLESLVKAKNQLYNGDGLATAQGFFELSYKNVKRYRPDIVGHFDVVTKFNQGNLVFDEQSSGYQNAALESLDAVLDVIGDYGGIVELNTGAWGRGLRNVPYPAPFLLRHMAQRNARVMIASDCHDYRMLDVCFPEAEQLMLDCGFSTVTTLENGQFVDRKLLPDN